MEASLAHKKAIAISFPFNGWGSWTGDDISTAVKVALQILSCLACHAYLTFCLTFQNVMFSKSLSRPQK